MYRQGIVKENDDAKCCSRVEYSDKDGVKSYWLAINQPAATASKHYAMPDVGALVNCLVDATGTEGTIIGAVYNDKDPPPITDGKHQHLALEGGGIIDYDRSNGGLTVTMPGGITITAAGGVTIVVGGSRFVITDGEIRSEAGKIIADGEFAFGDASPTQPIMLESGPATKGKGK
ncbi:phage baseplate assembly protein V [Xanthobacter sp. VTT E-85241]|uniref:phage baseplate assembly protein V n=1 Tax=Roseixanthobacter finlandensis TaxID=3119922 RepID=UPI00372B6681